jgi:hypothetical protein
MGVQLVPGYAKVYGSQIIILRADKGIKTSYELSMTEVKLIDHQNNR